MIKTGKSWSRFVAPTVWSLDRCLSSFTGADAGENCTFIDNGGSSNVHQPVVRAGMQRFGGYLTLPAWLNIVVIILPGIIAGQHCRRRALGRRSIGANE
jgi:hypothetical protein